VYRWDMTDAHRCSYKLQYLVQQPKQVYIHDHVISECNGNDKLDDNQVDSALEVVDNDNSYVLKCKYRICDDVNPNLR
jgi:hypothetical protein